MKFTISKNIIENTIEFLSTFVDNIDTFTPFRGIYIKINNSEITFIGGNSNIAKKKNFTNWWKKYKIRNTRKNVDKYIVIKKSYKKIW
ncbi:hypothetical protein [Mycoplasmopsis cynos]|uniref:hypothetical protein n=1 Tax=Mycoplasmopsis cynos TaxID=171284 RepID=UPI0022084C6F|nr:hypothetical protein [Mycoplasmopsis cynos]UWV76978.1 hypothetical protein NW070_04135 [Mycoplasmopsis cynos]